MGMSEAEIALVLGTNTLHCVQCGGEIEGYEVYCPHCGRNPK
jgi:Zn finger protein HypA/HybF involved in hydrogenase expression